MEIKPVAVYHSPLKEKFGLPRQAGIATALRGRVELLPEYKSGEALRGLEDFDYIWLLWGFHLNREGSGEGHLTVRPPRLGGNERIGVFASRSPYRPNPLGLSSVRIVSVLPDKGIIEVEGADLADGTPVYDIKPYVEYADSHCGVRSGFVDKNSWEGLEVKVQESLKDTLGENGMKAVCELIAQDPRPRYQDDPERIYHLKYGNFDVDFKISGKIAEIIDIRKIN